VDLLLVSVDLDCVTLDELVLHKEVLHVHSLVTLELNDLCDWDSRIYVTDIDDVTIAAKLLPSTK
jgi:hypothetical protein